MGHPVVLEETLCNVFAARFILTAENHETRSSEVLDLDEGVTMRGNNFT